MTAFNDSSYLDAGSDGSVIYQGGTFAHIFGGKQLLAQ